MLYSVCWTELSPWFWKQWLFTLKQGKNAVVSGVDTQEEFEFTTKGCAQVRTSNSVSVLKEVPHNQAVRLRLYQSNVSRRALIFWKIVGRYPTTTCTKRRT